MSYLSISSHDTTLGGGFDTSQVSTSLSSLMTSSEAMATALANGFPPKVLRVINNKRTVSSHIMYPNRNTKKMADLK